jgi:hypothetical protein
MECSESETLMAILQELVLGEQRHPKQLQAALYCLARKSLPWLLIG